MTKAEAMVEMDLSRVARSEIARLFNTSEKHVTHVIAAYFIDKIREAGRKDWRLGLSTRISNVLSRENLVTKDDVIEAFYKGHFAGVLKDGRSVRGLGKGKSLAELSLTVGFDLSVKHYKDIQRELKLAEKYIKPTAKTRRARRNKQNEGGHTHAR